jgi:hypothetical protein
VGGRDYVRGKFYTVNLAPKHDEKSTMKVMNDGIDKEKILAGKIKTGGEIVVASFFGEKKCFTVSEFDEAGITVANVD